MVIATATHRAGGEGKESKSIGSDTNRARTRKLGQAVREVIGIVEALSPFALSPRSQRPGASTALPEGGPWMSCGIVRKPVEVLQEAVCLCSPSHYVFVTQ